MRSFGNVVRCCLESDRSVRGFVVEAYEPIPEVVAEILRQESDLPLPSPLADVHEFVEQKDRRFTADDTLIPIRRDEDGVSERNGRDTTSNHAEHPWRHYVDTYSGDVEVAGIKTDLAHH